MTRGYDGEETMGGKSTKTWNSMLLSSLWSSKSSLSVFDAVVHAIAVAVLAVFIVS